MTNPTNPGPSHLQPSVRQQIIDGLRALADLLEADPALPVGRHGYEFLSFPPPGMHDAAAIAVVDQVAERLGVTVDDDRPWGGHYEACKSLAAGWVTYRFVHIPARAAAEHQARNSYRDNITVTDDQADCDQADRDQADRDGRRVA
ncbi:hypothetical protein ABZ801_16165 [Actinomadura sp. NPDC047616]|uniref:hypothetical protein n=1 Tax=Actinomadura sp. NPDC047616 TaxID=3155914 RepID=UPI0033F6B3A8